MRIILLLQNIKFLLAFLLVGVVATFIGLSTAKNNISKDYVQKNVIMFKSTTSELDHTKLVDILNSFDLKADTIDQSDSNIKIYQIESDIFAIENLSTNISESLNNSDITVEFLRYTPSADFLVLLKIRYIVLSILIVYIGYVLYVFRNSKIRLANVIKLITSELVTFTTEIIFYIGILLAGANIFYSIDNSVISILTYAILLSLIFKSISIIKFKEYLENKSSKDFANDYKSYVITEWYLPVFFIIVFVFVAMTLTSLYIDSLFLKFVFNICIGFTMLFNWSNTNYFIINYLNNIFDKYKNIKIIKMLNTKIW
jgi:hypothetical protein